MAIRVAVLASGGGTNFENLARHASGIGMEIAVLISDKHDAFAITRAQNLGIPHHVHSRKDFDSKAAHEAAILETLSAHDVSYVLLAGFMRILSPHFIETYDHRIINLHPSLLPSFKGRDGIRDAYEYGVKVTGVTIHYVDAGIDTGEIIAQVPVQIEAGDTLEDVENKIHKVEYALYPAAIKKVLKERDDEESTH
ncbi:phosphoribosylglycinamide formyltransferase [Salinicoccus hispanicus]|uniref:phosphoribosylglycinamide formyltransferase n=1 Tax=Salinicoccus hispanicus TaxID=157225 RepID=UPI0014788B9B|nr:phosphoribosylglycinamide formyltransferase [Salinicoccus hispanicus]